MNRHYDWYLTKKYEPMYRDRHGEMRDTAMCWGFGVGDGWFNLINTLSRELCYGWLEAKRKYDKVKDGEGQLYAKLAYNEDNPESKHNYRITADIIAECKAAMELQADLVPIAVQVKEKFGGLRFYVATATPEQYNIISFAEHLSMTTCDVCGKMGKRSGRGWIVTRCKEHR